MSYTYRPNTSHRQASTDPQYYYRHNHYGLCNSLVLNSKRWLLYCRLRNPRNKGLGQNVHPSGTSRSNHTTQKTPTPGNQHRVLITSCLTFYELAARCGQYHNHTCGLYRNAPFSDIVHGCTVYTERAETTAVSCSQVTTKQRCKYTSWMDIKKAL